MKKIAVFVPRENVEEVKNAMFDAGAGIYKNYKRCCWQTDGIGQFMPIKNANPHIGELHKVQQVKETKIEILCNENCLAAVLNALKTSHPYESPAFEVSALEEWGN